MAGTIFKKIEDFVDKFSMRILIPIMIVFNLAWLGLLVNGHFKISNFIWWVVLNTICLFVIVLSRYNIRKQQILELESYLTDEASKLHLCGFDINTYIWTDAFRRFIDWTDGKYCWAMAAIGMFILKDNHTAIMYKGICNRHGKDSIYYWVEFDFENCRYVLDLGWVGGFMYRKSYDEMLKPDIKWALSHQDFWDIQASSRLYESMCDAKTSYILDLLAYLYYNEDIDKGFADDIDDFEIRSCTEYYCMPPIPIDESKICWFTTLQDFVKNLKRKQPKTRTQRIARRALRYSKKNAPSNPLFTETPV